MKTWLTVPYEEKDEAKRLGARWSPIEKRWYVENVENIGAFLKWIPPTMAHLLRPCADVRK